ncbi:MAG: YbhB/YbcL family Raf kinase inhibitor-like protein [Solirubrobacteraceae bacterium]
MPKLLKPTPGIALLAALALAGCGSSNVQKPLKQVLFRSTGVVGHRVPARYTCDGTDIAPPLEWGSVPAGTAELALFLVGFKPKPESNTYSISVEWAIAGVNPQLHKLTAGRLPAGAYPGVASSGKQRYSLCPPKGQSAKYQFELYGVPSSGAISSGFSALPTLVSLNHRTSPATAHGAFPLTYKRR